MACCPIEHFGAVSTREPAAVAGLGAVYVAATGGSHPLAKRVGVWPSVVAAAVVIVAAAEVVTRVGRPLAEGPRGGSADLRWRPCRVEVSPQNPHNSGLEGRSPQKTHGQNGLIRHAAARLLA